MNLAQKIEQKRKAKKIAERNKKMKIASAGIAAGVTAGALGGILLAPKSGKETREDIKGKSKEVANTINEKTKEAKSNLDEKLALGKDNFLESKKKIREYLDSKKVNKGLIDTTEEVNAIEEPQTSEEAGL
ncbi:YtxH domain-containing protein [Paraclostridium bifermentans]|uniref:YtxH domain-containing protein n=1 Tax=Paraclostridium bifermentans TaxID=1490 RepID=UPI00359CB5A3